MEATAQWAQHEAIPTDTSFTGNIVAVFDEPWIHMDSRNPLGTDPHFGDPHSSVAYSTAFPFYMIEKLQQGQSNPDIIRQTWVKYSDTHYQCGPMKPAIDATLPPNKSLIGIFPDYAEANYLLAYTGVSDNNGTISPIRDVLSAFEQSRGQTIPADYRPVVNDADIGEQHLNVTLPTKSTFYTIQPLGVTPH